MRSIMQNLSRFGYARKKSAGEFETSTLAELQSEHVHGVVGSPQLPPSLVQPAVQPQFNTTPSILIANTPSTILQDLERCSEAMGVSEESLSSRHRDLEEISKRAQLFLDYIQPLLPSKFLRQYRNPCWMAKKPKVQLNWNTMLMTFFRPKSKGLKLGMNKNFSHFLSKPVAEDGGGNLDEEDLFCLPYFFLAGFPKSATTTIHVALRQLSQIVGPAEKEPHWWTRVLSLNEVEEFDRQQIQLAFTAYTRFFEKMRKPTERNTDKISYDGSQSTLWDSNFFYNGQDYCAMPAVISRVLPDAKFIVVLRNPVTRLLSHYLFSCTLRYGSIDKWPKEVKDQGNHLFHLQVEKELKHFNRCKEELSDFECASIRASSRDKTERINSTEFHCGVVWHRLTIGMYVTHIKKWLQFYPMENFLFIKMEDISKDPARTISRITDFLNIAPVQGEIATGRLFSRAQNAFNKKLPPMHRRTKLLLEHFYQPYNEELAQVLNDERFLWAS